MKIVLTSADMIGRNMDFQSLERENPETKRFIIELLQDLKNQEKIDIINEKIYIEAFSQNNGGCIVYISVVNIENLNKDKVYLICEFADIETLLGFSNSIKKTEIGGILSSELYRDDECYRLILLVKGELSGKFANLTNEFGIVAGKTEIEAAKTKERFWKIIPFSALESLKKLLP